MYEDQTMIKSLTLEDIFSQGFQYSIPVYQRNYAWQEQHIVQLLHDVRDYYSQSLNLHDYYMGTLIVNAASNNVQTLSRFEVIDGQQRLTTFNLIACALKFLLDPSEHFYTEFQGIFTEPVLGFESRPMADQTLQQLAQYGAILPDFSQANPQMVEGFNLITKQLKHMAQLFKDQGQSSQDFSGYLNYLFKHVIIMQVQVPSGIDLNHYFEIMNTRGEQLEKHEVLKATLLSYLSQEAPASRTRFNAIWEACADMHRYIQLHPNFSPILRTEIFGKHWFNFIPKDHHALLNCAQFVQDNQHVELRSFTDLVHGYETLDKSPNSQSQIPAVDENDQYRFHSIINFENFLLHALKTFALQQQNASEFIPLDDKRLLSSFTSYVKNHYITPEQKAEFSKTFIYHLLRLRFLFDQYVLKSDAAGENVHWSLKMVRCYLKESKSSFSYVKTFNKQQYDENNKNQYRVRDEVIRLLAMFHVSNPTLIYKNWLFAVLHYLSSHYRSSHQTEDLEKPVGIDLLSYRNFLRTTAIDFLKYRYLNEHYYDYDTIVLKRHTCKAPVNWQQYLSYPTLRNNLVFNFIDYLLWQEQPTKYANFEFSFRSSVEHFYPQQPKLQENQLKDQALLHCLGNLCLISATKNASLSNDMPIAKVDHYSKATSQESIKQSVMLERCKQDRGWQEAQIQQHHADIIMRLTKALELLAT